MNSNQLNFSVMIKMHNNITRIHFCDEQAHDQSGLGNAAKTSNTVYHENFAVYCVNYARGFLLTLAEIDHRLM